MTSEKLKLLNEVDRLMLGDTIPASKDMLNILSECLLKINYGQLNEPVNSKMEAEAKLVSQMIFTKILNLRNLLDGVSFFSNAGISLNNVLDPTVTALLARNIYETVATFHIVYINPKNIDEKNILYNMWVIAGLKYRQKFKAKAITPDSKKTQVDEANIITQLINEIYQSVSYLQLDAKGKEVIKDMICRKDYKVDIKNSTAKSLHWQEISTIMGLDELIMGDIYTYFSLYSHPSNVSVSQFEYIFNDIDKTNNEMCKNYVKNVAIWISVFISDYIKLFPNAMEIFDELPIINQIVINLNHKMALKNRSVINNALDVLSIS
jgi:hypothetical protein